jgi:hypothetical protein
MKRFDATLDSLSRTLTFVLCVVMVIPFIAIARQAATSGDMRLLIAPVVVVIILGIVLLYRVKGYGLDAGSLTIFRPLKPPVIPLSSIRSIESVTQKDLGAGVRTFGNGGFMGYTGRFYYRNIGHANLYVTDRSKLLLITLNDDRKIIISPEDPPAFMKAFLEIRKQRRYP